MTTDRFSAQQQRMATGTGFIAALDQSGGSTPKALAAYGIVDSWSSDDEMFDLMHAMRSRIIMSPAFTGDQVLGAILFEMTMDRMVDGRPTAEYLWEHLNVVPFLKVDKGLEPAVDAELMEINFLAELRQEVRYRRRIRLAQSIRKSPDGDVSQVQRQDEIRPALRP